MLKTSVRLAVLALLPCLLPASDSARRIRISTWYWLNSVPKSQWATDFKDMRALGCSDVLLVWGLDATAFSFRVTDSRQAIEQAHAAGLGSYLFIWHARHNSLDHRPNLEQVDAGGNHLFAFDTFNPEWRAGPWTTYLQTLARSYEAEPGLAGYVFDNSFAIGQIGGIDGPTPKPDENYLSFGAAEKLLFQRDLPRSAKDQSWGEWTRAREGWWADWARETAAVIRAIDTHREHEIFIEDGANAIDSDTAERAGVDFKRVAKEFDTVGAYFAPAYSANASGSQLAIDAREYLRRMQTAGGSKIALSLRLSEGDKEDLPGPAAYPTLEQIRVVVDAALALGVRHIDLYGYSMGIYHLDKAGWERYRPRNDLGYPLTGQISQKFLCDRRELWPGLRTYFAGLSSVHAH